LLALGFGRRSIEHRVARGRLFPVSLGVYAVGWPALNQKRRWMAAVLAGGAGAALSHRSAAALWEIGSERGEFVVAELDSIALERAVNDADKRDLVDPEALREDLHRFSGCPGIRPLRHLLDKLFFRLSDSDLEIYFRRIVQAATLPMPLTKQRVNRFEVDFFWPALGLVVETDGLRYHRTPSAELRDARRDRAHVMAGMTPLRFTHYEVRYEPDRVRAVLVKTIAMLRKRARIWPQPAGAKTRRGA
jgi:very-short-patch-repair endonuclease